MTTPMSLKPYDKFSSISNKTMVAIFPNVCLWRRSYAQNWEVLTLKNCYSIEPPSYANTAYVVASYGPRFFSTVLDKQFTAPPSPPPWQKIARTPMFQTISKSAEQTTKGTKITSSQTTAHIFGSSPGTEWREPFDFPTGIFSFPSKW